jgi:hyperosmotically inducible periplasmic protein
MKLISEGNQTANPAWLRKIRNMVLLGGLGVLIPSTAVFAQAPDNSKSNKQERGAATADQQAENPGDRDVARKIRKSIMDDKNLSTYAHNVKVIARGGTVILKGPVRSDEEKTAIEAKAVEVAGAANVKNELTVKPKTEN